LAIISNRQHGGNEGAAFARTAAGLYFIRHPDEEVISMAIDSVEQRDEKATAQQRTTEQQEAYEKLLKMAEEQGVKPLDFDALRAKADFWPEDESVDDFIAAVQEWRSEGGERELP
jgi:hypothetical protein